MIRKGLTFLLVLMALLMIADVVLAQVGISKQPMMWVIARKLTVETDADIVDDLNVGGDVNVTGTITSGSAITNGVIQENTIVSGTLGISGTVTLENAETIANSVDGIITMTVPATGFVNVATGNLKVGNGEPGQTLDGEDAYVKGLLEVDGTVHADGDLNVGDDLTVAGSIIGTMDQQNMIVPTWVSTAFTYTAEAGFTDGTVVAVPAGEVWAVHSVLCQTTVTVTVEDDDDETLVVGTADDPNGFLDLVHADLTTTATEGTGWAAGWSGMAAANIGVFLDDNNNSFILDNSAGTVPITITATLDAAEDDFTAGEFSVYVNYSRLQ